MARVVTGWHGLARGWYAVGTGWHGLARVGTDICVPSMLHEQVMFYMREVIMQGKFTIYLFAARRKSRFRLFGRKTLSKSLKSRFRLIGSKEIV